MAVLVKLDEMLKRRKMTSKELCDLIGITEANISILRSGKAKAIRFSTLNKICYFLGCKPADVIDFDGILGDDNDEKN